MLFATDAASLIQVLRVVDANQNAVTGIPYDDVDLQVSYKLQAGSAFVSPTLVAGTIGTYLANSWVEISDGLYQWCPSAAAVVANSATVVRLTYDGLTQYDTIEPKLASPTTLAAIALSLAGSRITVTSRVSGSTITAYMGDDFKVRSGTELELTVTDTAGALHDKLDAIGIGNLAFGAARPNQAAGEITGSIAALSYASNVTTISIEITACGSSLQPDTYTYQIQSTQAQSGDSDDYIEIEGTLTLKQRTVAALG